MCRSERLSKALYSTSGSASTPPDVSMNTSCASSIDRALSPAIDSMSSVSSSSGSQADDLAMSEADIASVASQETYRMGMQRHEKYYFEEVNVKLSIDDLVYNIPRILLTRHSEWFRERFAQPADCLPPGWTTPRGERVFVNHSPGLIQDERPSASFASDVYRLYGASKGEFDVLLSVLLPDNYERHNLSKERWAIVLRLASVWNFTCVRALARMHLTSLLPDMPLKRLIFAREHDISEIATAAMQELIERNEPLEKDEATQLTVADIVSITKGREEGYCEVINDIMLDIRRLATEPNPTVQEETALDIRTLIDAVSESIRQGWNQEEMIARIMKFTKAGEAGAAGAAGSDGFSCTDMVVSKGAIDQLAESKTPEEHGDPPGR